MDTDSTESTGDRKREATQFRVPRLGYTALAILECAEVLGAWDPFIYAHRKYVELRLRYLERMALGTPYP